MVLLASAYDQSRFFKAADLTQEKKLRIKEVTEELIGVGADQKKMLTVWFTNDDRGLPLNRTNNRTIRGAFGDPVNGWTNKIIVLFPTQADFRGRMVPCLRVRIPPPKQATGNGQGQTAAAKPAPAEPPPPPATTTVADDLDDEIEF
jgi:hypothetical protein